MNTVSNKNVVEIVPIIFDYSNLITAGISTIISVTVLAVNGADPTASTMALGAPAIVDRSIVQLIQGGVKGVTYQLSCLVEVVSERYLIEGLIIVD